MSPDDGEDAGNPLVPPVSLSTPADSLIVQVGGGLHADYPHLEHSDSHADGPARNHGDVAKNVNLTSVPPPQINLHADMVGLHADWARQEHADSHADAPAIGHGDVHFKPGPGTPSTSIHNDGP